MSGLSHHRGVAACLCAVAILLIAAGAASAAQFGMNKVQYRTFQWKIEHTEHFDVYFYEGSEDIADAVGVIVEDANSDFERVLGHKLSTVIPVIVYASHNDFEQTNVSSQQIEETVGGFTELFKNRVVVPFTGSYADLRHVLYHELTHVFMFDIVYGGLVESVIRQAYTNPVPLWFAEGLAEYVSQGWDPEAEMILRDLTLSDRVVPLEQLYGGYIVYKEGQAAFAFIAERYGEPKIAEVVKVLARTHNLDVALRQGLGLTTPELSEELDRWLRERYWPEISERERGEDFAKLITDHSKDGSYLNLGAAVSPDGAEVVYVSDKSGYADIYVASTLDGQVLRKLVNGERSDEFETLHILRTGLSWSPDGDRVCFVAKAGASDAIQIVDAERGKLTASLRFDLDGMFTPSWSPDGGRIVFVGTKNGASDLYVTDPAGTTLTRLTDDFFDERGPSWSPDGSLIAFGSDRDSPEWLGFRRTYDIYTIDPETRKIERIIATTGDDRLPSWSPDGRTIAYASDRDGSVQLYLADLDSRESVRATHLSGGASDPSWSRTGERFVFSLYQDVGWDVASIKDPLGVLEEESRDAVPFPSIEEPLPEPEVVAEESEAAEEPEESAVEPPPEELAYETSTEPHAPVGTEEPRPESESVRRAREAFRAAEVGRNTAPEEPEERRPGTVDPYRPKFTPDWVSGGFAYTSGYGLSGAAQIAVSDVLGNHRFYIASDFFSSIESSNFYVLYEQLARRTNFSFGVYNFKEYYYSERTRLGEDLGEKRYFAERSYGVSAGLSYPFSRFTRVELGVDALSLDRQFAAEDQYGDIVLTDERVRRSLVIPSVRLVNDTTLWGSVGPLSGGRSSFVVSRAWEPGGDFSYMTEILDFRRYLRLGMRHSLALKLVGARSAGTDPQNFYMGGVNSLRGYDDFEFHGRQLALASVEFRYPFIDRLQIASPLPISLWGLRGVAFLDLGAAWDDDFRGVIGDGATRLDDIKAGYGVGVRMQLAFFVIRVDRAWPTDFHRTGEPRTHFALGAEF
jgi:hypothetical protein